MKYEHKVELEILDVNKDKSVQEIDEDEEWRWQKKNEDWIKRQKWTWKLKNYMLFVSFKSIKCDSFLKVE